MKNETPNIHESQPSRPFIPEEPYKDDLLEGLQRTEGGGPMRRVDMNVMPKPLRYFGYSIMAVMLVGVAIIIVSGYLK
ncbi:hypothetical protein ACX1C1_09065 [Paenibacillus sp. strain BS8-2]